ncbi:MAG: hypothetical protein LBF75_10490, partial [Treponema sp.]|nr:hypothetical protein [Treponema sp.]
HGIFILVKRNTSDFKKIPSSAEAFFLHRTVNGTVLMKHCGVRPSFFPKIGFPGMGKRAMLWPPAYSSKQVYLPRGGQWME